MTSRDSASVALAINFSARCELLNSLLTLDRSRIAFLSSVDFRRVCKPYASVSPSIFFTDFRSVGKVSTTQSRMIFTAHSSEKYSGRSARLTTS